MDGNGLAVSAGRAALKLLFGKDDLLAKWVASQIPHVSEFGPSRAIGIMDDDRILGAIVYHDYQPLYRTCQISMASSSPKWCTKRVVKDILAFPFIQYGCNKVWTATPHTSERVIKFNLALGFRREATLKDHFGPKSHAVICEMHQKYFLNRYMKEMDHGKKQGQSAAAA